MIEKIRLLFADGKNDVLLCLMLFHKTSFIRLIVYWYHQTFMVSKVVVKYLAPIVMRVIKQAVVFAGFKG